MIYTVDIKLAFEKASKAQALRDALLPFFREAININEGKDNQEISFVEVRKSYHDEPSRTTPDEILARWEVGKGRVI